MSRWKHNLIVSGLAAALVGLLFSGCVCGPTRVQAPVQVAASMPVDVELRAEVAALRTEIGARAGRDVIAENTGWVVAFAIGWPMLCVLAGFIIYMVSNRIPAVLAAKDRVKGLSCKTGILDAPKPKRTPPAVLPVVAVCPKCGAEFSPRLSPTDGANELNG